MNRLQTSTFQNNRNSSYKGVRTFGKGCDDHIPRSEEGLYMPVYWKKHSSVYKPNFCSQTTPAHSQFFTLFNSGSLCNLWANKQLMQGFLTCYLKFLNSILLLSIRQTGLGLLHFLTEQRRTVQTISEWQLSTRQVTDRYQHFQRVFTTYNTYQWHHAFRLFIQHSLFWELTKSLSSRKMTLQLQQEQVQACCLCEKDLSCTSNWTRLSEWQFPNLHTAAVLTPSSVTLHRTDKSHV